VVPGLLDRPWQLEGHVIRTLLEDGYRDLIAAHNRTVVVDAYVGERNNKHKLVTDKYGLRNVHLYEPEVEWVRYEPKSPCWCWTRSIPTASKSPLFFDKNIIQLPTVKTHVFTTITGAMKNAFGGPAVGAAPLDPRGHPRDRRRSAGHPAGDPQRALCRHGRHLCRRRARAAGDVGEEKDLILASADQVAIDAVSAYLQGFEPLDLPSSAWLTSAGWGWAT
jgi:uncharacterized protein (DUF362 family)